MSVARHHIHPEVHCLERPRELGGLVSVLFYMISAWPGGEGGLHRGREGGGLFKRLLKYPQRDNKLRHDCRRDEGPSAAFYAEGVLPA